ncbi:MAG TPA: sulfite exporter TauE/SafE family protein [Solirubrobacteraceae bacterium]|nr:sulfite exporter TauE/SafE family protein [Solirubrobacteraceae bacterium]
MAAFDLTPFVAIVVIGVGAVAGALGALLGVGGGVFLVPFLNAVLGLPFNVASGVGLMTVIATSSVVSAASGRRPVNLRLGMLLQIASSAGGLVGGVYVARMPPRALYILFALVTGAIAAITLSRLDRRNVILDGATDPGQFGGRYFEEESRQEVVYRTRNLPVAFAVSLAGGSVSGLLGIGGGILQVPALNAWCGVPLRAAAATSAVMIGVTAVASAPIYYSRGDVVPPLAAAAVIGVLGGSRFGFWFGDRARSKWLKVLLAGVLLSVSSIYVGKSL